MLAGGKPHLGNHADSPLAARALRTSGKTMLLAESIDGRDIQNGTLRKSKSAPMQTRPNGERDRPDTDTIVASSCDPT